MIDGGKIYGYCEVDGVQLASCYYADSTGELQRSLLVPLHLLINMMIFTSL